MMDLASYLESTKTSQAAFADLVGVKQPTVNRWLNTTARPTWGTALRIEQVTAGAVPVSSWVQNSTPSSDAPLSEAS